MSTNETSVPYFDALADAVGLFDELKIGYALIGGVAAMFYGRARFTEDLDFVAVTGHANVLEQNSKVMRKFHFDPACTWKLYHESGVDIDIWKDKFSDEIAERAVGVNLNGQTVHIVELHDLIAMKLRAGRLQDDYDISEAIKASKIDDEIVRNRVSQEQFQHYLEIKRR